MTLGPCPGASRPSWAVLEARSPYTPPDGRARPDPTPHRETPGPPAVSGLRPDPGQRGRDRGRPLSPDPVPMAPGLGWLAPPADDRDEPPGRVVRRLSRRGHARRADTSEPDPIGCHAGPLMPRGRPPTSPARCVRCGLADPRRLFAVTLQRSYRPRRADGSRPRQRTLAIAARLCAPCARELARERGPAVDDLLKTARAVG